MNKNIGSIAFWAVVAVIMIGGGYFIYHTITTPVIHYEHPLIDYKNMTYTIAGKPVTLVNGTASTEIATGSASTAITQYYGDNLYKDLNGDGVPDSVFLVTQNNGGSGTFYYVVAGVSTATSSVGSQSYYLGDRIVPQSVTSGPGKSIVVTYVDRTPDESFSLPPTHGKSVTLTLDPTSLAWQVVDSSTASSTVTASSTNVSMNATSSATGGAATTTVPSTTPAVNLAAIPLGDGKISNGPRAGYVYSCSSNFRGGGASHSGAWITGTTWNQTTKPTVQGNIYWPSATFATYLEGNQRLLKGNGLPVNAPTGIFPIAPSDPAYQYDHNPNNIAPYTVSVLIPKYPSFAAAPSCVPMGPIGYALNGVAIFNALDDSGRDAVAHEIQDKCDGHPQSGGEYHYHGPSPCMPHAKDANALVGYALDGFGIYSQYKADGSQYTNADLDACHGTTTPVLWNGKIQKVYHYVMTAEYPYTVGCFRGTPVRVAAAGHTASASSGQTASTNNTVPAAAVTACRNAQDGASCSFRTPKGLVNGTCRIPPSGNSLACIPG